MPSTLGNTRTERYPKSEEAILGVGPLARVPPHSIDAEQALLASCILEGGQECITLCLEAKIRVDAFYKPAHQKIYEALLELYKEGKDVDDIVLGDKLQAMGYLELIGGYAYINEVTDRIDTPAHMAHYLSSVRDLALVRRLIRTSTQTIENAYTRQGDLESFLESVEQEIFKISEDRITETARPIKDSIDSAVNAVNQMLQRKGALTGITSGFADLDKLTSGFHPAEMIVVAARPSMGKTAIALNMIEPSVLCVDPSKRVPTLLFSLEMSAQQIAMRLLCSHSHTDMQKLRDGFIDKATHSDLARAASRIRDAPLWIDDSGSLSILEMRAKARRIHSQKKLGLIVIDYLQLISGSDSRVPREQQVAEISRGIKSMAKELNVPVIVAAQLNRESEKEKRQPRISDLRESGSIEQDADLVLLLSKPREYDENEEQTASILLRDLIVAKQRNGPVGCLTLTFNKRLTRFDNYSGADI